MPQSGGTNDGGDPLVRGAAGVTDVTGDADVTGAAGACERAFDASPVSMLLLDAELCIRRVNAAFERFVGHGADRLTGRPLASLVHARDRSALDSSPVPEGPNGPEGPEGPDGSAPAGLRRELRFVRGDGSAVWGELHLADASGAGDGADTGAGADGDGDGDGGGGGSGGLRIASIVDIAAHKALERELGSLAAVVENATDLVLVFDTALEIRYVNAAGLHILGLDGPGADARIVGSCVLDAVWPADLARIDAEAVPALRATGSWSGRLRYRNFRTGEPIETLWNVSAIRDGAGEITAWTTISPNLAEMLATEHALQEKSAALATADRHKDRVLSRLGHEMRNPMNALVNGLDVVAFSQDPLERDEVVAMMQRQTRQLAALIDDLVDVARVQAGHLRIERRVRDLVPFVRQVVEERRYETRRLGVRLELETPGDVPGDMPVHVAFDEARLRQVLNNLLGNALRAVSGTVRPGRLHVAVEADREAGTARVRVRDNGCGIEAVELEAIFQPFERGNTSPGDSGLGLAIARELAAGHGGRLEVDSDGPDRGATFTLALPLAPLDACVDATGTQDARSEADARDEDIATSIAGLALGAPVAGREAPRKVLLIDDDVDSLDVLHRILKRFGHDAYRASDGRSGVALALELQPDVVICDIGMPGMNGYSVARALRKRTDLRGTRLIGLTGYADARTATKALEAGFDRHVAKPIDAAGLRSLVEGGQERDGGKAADERDAA